MREENKKEKTKHRRKNSPALEGNPQKKGNCIKIMTKKPKKPNSAIRRKKQKKEKWKREKRKRKKGKDKKYR